MMPGKLITMGDFNIQWDNKLKSDTKRFSELLDVLELQQTISDPTHQDGHTLDFVISRASDKLLMSSYASTQLSDHHVVHAILDLLKPSYQTKNVTYRKYCEINQFQLSEDIKASPIEKEQSDKNANISGGKKTDKKEESARAQNRGNKPSANATGDRK